MDATTVALVAVCISCVLLYRRLRRSKKNEPPSIPFLWLMVRSIFTKDDPEPDPATPIPDVMKLSGFNTIILMNYRAMHEAFVVQGDVFSGRPKSELFRQISHDAGVGSTDGPVWQEHRRLMLRLLREFGLGRSLLSDLITEECVAMRDRLENGDGEPVDSQQLFSEVTNNVIARLVFGQRCGTEDPNFAQFCENVRAQSEQSLGGTLAFLCPWILRFSAGKKFINCFTRMFIVTEKTHDYIREKIDAQAALLREANPPPTNMNEATNICEAFLIEQARHEAAAPGQHTFTEWQIIRNMTDLFLAGTETTATTLQWAMAFMAIHPEVQARVQTEIEAKIGRQRSPTMADRHKVPYTCAVMDEIMRASTLLPTNVFHRTTRDTVLLGFDIPADCQIQCNILSIHTDPKLWKHPKEFSPENFLSPDGEYQASKYLVPFSIGKRACLGESLARMEYFLAFATLMQTFEVRLADPNVDKKALITGKGKWQFIRRPLPHKVVFTKLEDR